MGTLNTLFSSPIFWAIIISVCFAQLMKVFLLIFKQKQKFVWNDLFITGNMPSAHAAIVTSLTTIILLTEGFTPLFFAVFVFSCIVIRDAVGVRRTVGEESKVLTTVIITLKKKFHLNIPRKMHESPSDQPVHVLVGSVIRFLSRLLVYFYF